MLSGKCDDGVGWRGGWCGRGVSQTVTRWKESFDIGQLQGGLKSR